MYYSYNGIKNSKGVELLGKLKAMRLMPEVKMEEIADILSRAFNQSELQALINFLEEIKEKKYGTNEKPII